MLGRGFMSWPFLFFSPLFTNVGGVVFSEVRQGWAVRWSKYPIHRSFATWHHACGGKG